MSFLSPCFVYDVQLEESRLLCTLQNLNVELLVHPDTQILQH